MRKLLNQTLEKNVLDEPEINLTPLIDVVFVILVTFIVIAPLLEIDQIALAEGKGKPIPSQGIDQTRSLNLYVRSDNTIWLNQTKVTPKQLYFLLAQEKKNHPHKRLVLYHDQKGFFGTYQMIKSTAEKAGFEELDIILKPESGKHF